MRLKARVHEYRRSLYVWRRRRAFVRRGVDESWRSCLPSEAAWWDTFIKSEGGQFSDEYRSRLDPQLELQPYVAQFVPASGPIRILDVGAGPLTILGKVVPGRELEIVATDALADEYGRQLAAAGVVPLVRTLHCETEQVSERFDADSFDIVHARNTLDHHRDPLRSIDEMLVVAKPGGVIVLSHAVDEGDQVGYKGLHSWNFTSDNDELVLWNPSVRVNIDSHLEGRATRVFSDGGADGEYLTAAYQKVGRTT